jgi:hypothetical protein
LHGLNCWLNFIDRFLAICNLPRVHHRECNPISGDAVCESVCLLSVNHIQPPNLFYLAVRGLKFPKPQRFCGAYRTPRAMGQHVPSRD